MSEEALRNFAKDVLNGYLGKGDIGSIEGATLEGLAVQYGLLAPVKAVGPCCENCPCAEWDSFPQTCYRPTKVLLGEGFRYPDPVDHRQLAIPFQGPGVADATGTPS